MTLEAQIIAVLKENLGMTTEEVNLESRLIEDLGVDSLDRIMIQAALEDEFSITINDEDFAGLRTVDDIVKGIKDRLS
ncbi:MAG: acyl carrier protein [Clostridia bacterium]|jgi:acyl carrier protein|nr:acyl carrier protein [Clostridia bacterium]